MKTNNMTEIKSCDPTLTGTGPLEGTEPLEYPYLTVKNGKEVDNPYSTTVGWYDRTAVGWYD